ncbi:hypothetical protein GA0115249_106360 [Streptomyces sp. PpalLS-921]|nr:hypothetical protein GA0115249_106360 [Streptomyces sp. PpalLS-921]
MRGPDDLPTGPAHGGPLTQVPVTALGRADAAAHLRFETLLSEMAGIVQGAGRHVTPAGPRAWECKSWADDLDRVVVALSRQIFAFADSLLSRWLVRFNARELDEKGLYLFVRSTTLLGDLKRDQGSVLGPSPPTTPTPRLARSSSSSTFRDVSPSSTSPSRWSRKKCPAS